MKKYIHMNASQVRDLVEMVVEKLDLKTSSKVMTENITNNIIQYLREAAEEGDDDEEIRRYKKELLGTTIYWETEDEYPFYIEIPVLRDIWRWESNDVYNGRICLCGSNGQCIAVPPEECDELLANGYVNPENGEIMVLVKNSSEGCAKKKLMNHLLLLKGKRGLIHDNRQRKGT